MMIMKLVYTLLVALISAPSFLAQETTLPIWMTPEEEAMMPAYLESLNTKNSTQPPVGSEIRTPGQWEELQAVLITWTSFPAIHRQLVQAIQQEAEVWIVTQDSVTVKNNIVSNGGSLVNVRFIHAPFNTIWTRDYGPNSVYLAGVDSLAFVNWQYNRPRPNDNNVPIATGAQRDIPVYSMTADPNDIVNCGGNFMADGFGSGFASKLVLNENQGTGFSQSFKTEAQVDDLMNAFMGLNRYIKMETLPYDGIHHIDMHMKLLNEETLLVGEFPEGISDGPQLELNLQYVLDNFMSPFGTPYKVVRIPMIPSPNGLNWPGQPFGNASYRTYANGIFVNKTFIVPVYREEYDTTGLRILQEAMPGYNIVGIDVDDSGNNLISQGGAIHCITKDVASSDPLLISHQNLPDTEDNVNPYQVQALIRHKSGINTATLYFTTDLNQPYTAVPMTATGNNQFTGLIPAQPGGTRIYYYIHATSVSGKQQVRPIVAPEGYFTFKVLETADIQQLESITYEPLFPNPTAGLTCIPLNNAKAFNGKLYVVDASGREVYTVHEGYFQPGPRKYFLEADHLPSGIYQVVLDSPQGRLVQKMAVK
jgi:agmatine deiminase